MAKEEGVTVKKSENFSEWYSQVLQKAELVDLRYGVRGFLVHLPWCVKIMKKIYQIVEKELEARGHLPFLFPATIPESFLLREKEHAEFSADVFWITESGEKGKELSERLALRPTSETAFYSMFSVWIRSWRNLPFKTYQSCQVWREESTTRPLLRGREFYWIEAHDAFASRKEAEAQVLEDMQLTKSTYESFCIPFLFFRRPEHDKFKGAVYTYAADTLLPDGRVLQLSSTHLLGQRFARAFNIRFTDKRGRKKYVWQTCHGSPVWRLVGAVAALHGDDKGLKLPPSVAPLHAIIIPIYFKGKQKEVETWALKLKQILGREGIESDADLRKEYTAGWKYNYWELKGVPLRVEVGPREVEKRQAVLVRRDTGEKIVVGEKEICQTARKLLEQIQENLRRNAQNFFDQHVFQAKNFEELKRILERRAGLVRTNWCGEKECADHLKAETRGGCIRGTLIEKKEKVFEKCVWCGKKALQVVYVAKEY